MVCTWPALRRGRSSIQPPTATATTTSVSSQPRQGKGGFCSGTGGTGDGETCAVVSFGLLMVADTVAPDLPKQRRQHHFSRTGDTLHVIRAAPRERLIDGPELVSIGNVTCNYIQLRIFKKRKQTGLHNLYTPLAPARSHTTAQNTLVEMAES